MDHTNQMFTVAVMGGMVLLWWSCLLSNVCRDGSKPAVDHRPFISNVDMAEDETYLDLFGLNGDGFKLTD